MKKHILTAIVLNLFCFLMLPAHALAFTDTITIIPMSAPEAETTEAADPSTDTKRGESLGMFTTTGYCNCSECNSSGFTLTWSGTVPTANHTIAADLDQYPVGTRLMIGDTIYTVEDMGPDVDGSRIDIYYDNHDDAVAHGTKTVEVFAVLP